MNTNFNIEAFLDLRNYADKQLHELTVTDLRALLNEIADTKTEKTNTDAGTDVYQKILMQKSIIIRILNDTILITLKKSIMKSGTIF